MSAASSVSFTSVANSSAVGYPALEKGLVAGKTRIGWIGTGVMGSSMCGHIMKSVKEGYPTTVYSRTIEKTASLRDSGAKVASNVDEVAANSDIIFTMLGYPSDVRSVYLGDASLKVTGVLNVLGRGGIVIDMTTSEPSLAQHIYAEAEKRGISAIDAPVSGGDIGAKEARLSIMVGGDHKAMYAVLPLFQAMGKNITYCGPAGSGQHTKMVNQILIATNMIGICEGLLYAHKSGLDPTTVIHAVSSGAAGSWSISNLGPRIVQRNFAPGFFVEHFIKDMGIALAEARKMKLALPGLAIAQQLYTALAAQGHERKGTQALILALEQLNGLNIPNDKPMQAAIVGAAETAETK